MAENLDFKFSGLAIGQSGTSYTELRANYFQNNEATYGVNGNKYGLLYNWAAVDYLEQNKVELIPGWHVPTSEEWDALATAVGGSRVAGLKLKSTTGWTSGNGDGSYGFNVFPAGNYNGSFINLGGSAYLWTATPYGINNGYGKSFSSNDGMSSVTNRRSDQYSVRLVKDIPSA